eukprot:Rmarinus@m.15286
MNFPLTAQALTEQFFKLCSSEHITKEVDLFFQIDSSLAIAGVPYALSNCLSEATNALSNACVPSTTSCISQPIENNYGVAYPLDVVRNLELLALRNRSICRIISDMFWCNLYAVGISACISWTREFTNSNGTEGIDYFNFAVNVFNLLETVGLGCAKLGTEQSTSRVRTYCLGYASILLAFSRYRTNDESHLGAEQEELLFACRKVAGTLIVSDLRTVSEFTGVFCKMMLFPQTVWDQMSAESISGAKQVAMSVAVQTLLKSFLQYYTTIAEGCGGLLSCRQNRSLLASNYVRCMSSREKEWRRHEYLSFTERSMHLHHSTVSNSLDTEVSNSNKDDDVENELLRMLCSGKPQERLYASPVPSGCVMPGGPMSLYSAIGEKSNLIHSGKHIPSQTLPAYFLEEIQALFISPKQRDHTAGGVVHGERESSHDIDPDPCGYDCEAICGIMSNCIIDDLVANGVVLLSRTKYDASQESAEMANSDEFDVKVRQYISDHPVFLDMLCSLADACPRSLSKFIPLIRSLLSGIQADWGCRRQESDLPVRTLLFRKEDMVLQELYVRTMKLFDIIRCGRLVSEVILRQTMVLDQMNGNRLFTLLGRTIQCMEMPTEKELAEECLRDAFDTLEDQSLFLLPWLCRAMKGN